MYKFRIQESRDNEKLLNAYITLYYFAKHILIVEYYYYLRVDYSHYARIPISNYTHNITRPRYLCMYGCNITGVLHLLRVTNIIK